jgi:hypothetical protein
MSLNQGPAVAESPARNPYTDRNSLEFQFRARRFAKVRALIEAALAERGEARILDLGGTETYWLIGEDFIRQNRDKLPGTEHFSRHWPAMLRIRISSPASSSTLFTPIQ